LNLNIFVSAMELGNKSHMEYLCLTNVSSNHLCLYLQKGILMKDMAVVMSHIWRYNIFMPFKCSGIFTCCILSGLPY
jgi:hypothetical protein